MKRQCRGEVIHEELSNWRRPAAGGGDKKTGDRLTDADASGSNELERARTSGLLRWTARRMRRPAKLHPVRAALRKYAGHRIRRGRRGRRERHRQKRAACAAQVAAVVQLLVWLR